MNGRLAIFAALLLGACSSSTESTASRVPKLGRYAYSGYGGDISGTLTLTYASADSVAGRWAVNGSNGPFYQPEVALGMWNLDAYVLYAKGAQATSVTYAHRIWRDGNAMQCTAKIVAGAAYACSLAYLGP